MSNGAITTVPYRAELNPPKDQPFTIEFWAKPSSSDNDDTTVFNRITTSPRAGWVFFQREESIGWNFRMHNGAGGTVGYDLTGGTYTVNSWSSAAAAVIFGWFRCLGCWTKLGELSHRGWVVGVGGRRFVTRSGSVRPVGGVREEFTFPFIFRPERLSSSGRGVMLTKW